MLSQLTIHIKRISSSLLILAVLLANLAVRPVHAANGGEYPKTLTITQAHSMGNGIHYRQAPAPAAKPTLSSLTLGTGVLLTTGDPANPYFVPDSDVTTTLYAVSYENAPYYVADPYEYIIATSTDPEDTVEVIANGVLLETSNDNITPHVGTNTIKVVVTDPTEEITQSYGITYTWSPQDTYSITGTILDNLGDALADVTVTDDQWNYAVTDAEGIYTLTGLPSRPGNPFTLTPSLGGYTFTPASQEVTINGASVTTGADFTGTAAGGAIDNVDLSSLSLSDGTLDPVFAADTTIYTASVANSVDSLSVTPTAVDPTTTITVNGAAVISGQASEPLALIAGSNQISVVVTSSDGLTSKTYDIFVTRDSSSNANLSGLNLSSGSLSPAFASATTAYTASVANNVSSITVTPTAADPDAIVMVNGGDPFNAVNLNVGSNTITILVTASDTTTTKTYTVTVTRAPSSNANLSGLSLSAGTLSPAFHAATTSYTASVANGVSSLTVTPTLAHANASVTVNGASPASPVNLSVGSNTITVVVTAQDGVTTKTYTIAVTRAPSNNANLSGLSLSSGALSPAFAAGTIAYTVNVGNNVSALTVTPTLADATASVTVNGVSVSSGAASGSISLDLGANTITVLVTAEDGTTTKTYTITVTRASSSNASLSGLTLSAGTLSPIFAADDTLYTGSVATGDTTITITPAAADPLATIKVNDTAVVSGQASGSIPLKVGSNTITIVVTAPDGVTTRTYTILLTRPGTIFIPFIYR